MMISKKMMMRAMVILGIIAVCWTVGKRIDAVFDNYHNLYMLHQGQKMVQETFQAEKDDFRRDWHESKQGFSDQQKFQREYDDVEAMVDGKKPISMKSAVADDNKESTVATQKPSAVPSGNATATKSEAEKDRKYEDRAVFKPTDNMPVPRKAEEATVGYYQGLFNLLFGRMYIAQYLIWGFVISGAWFAVRRVLRKVDAICDARGMT